MSSNSITQSSFGSYSDQEITKYVLSNSLGMQVSVINYGATITSITTPDANGSIKELACGFDSMEGYLSKAYKTNAPYFGCTVGRYASRIKDGKFNVDGVDYTTAVNNGSNHLHGGMVGFDKIVWKAEIDKENNALSMSLSSPHMDEGYPGNVNVKVTFSLNEENALSIKYSANSDAKTPLSLTNHTYFNLSGFAETIHNHKVQINSTRILEPDETNVPVGKISVVAGAIDDLSEGKLLSTCFAEMETGFEHYYLFEHPIGTLSQVASIDDSKSSLSLEIFTTEPGALFYTGYFTADDLKRENGDQYGRYRGFCFETSRYPNGPNIVDSPGSVTSPDTPYKSETIFKLHKRQDV